MPIRVVQPEHVGGHADHRGFVCGEHTGDRGVVMGLPA
jgi:hypothetical protein